MKILGLSNPQFQGVTVATKAIVTDYCGVGHIDNSISAPNIAREILNFNPDVLVVGGWSRGYDVLMAQISRLRKFPVVNVFHGTVFHGDYFGAEGFLTAIDSAYDKGHIDYRAYVHPQSVEYERFVRGRPTVWIPHYFPHLKRKKQDPIFRIGILGGADSWYKNGAGAITVAKEFCRQNKNCELVMNYKYDRRREDFLQILNSCSVLIHPSHLECYSNTVQEAWSRGIPVILSRANRGLTHSPLLEHKEIENTPVSACLLEDAIDPMELYEAIDNVREGWEDISCATHELHQKITKRAESYTSKVFKTMTEIYKDGGKTARDSRDHDVFKDLFFDRKKIWG